MIYIIKSKDGPEQEYEMNTLSQAYYFFGEDYLIEDLANELYPQLITKEEIKLLWEFLAHQHVGYENLPLIELVRKISSIANDEDSVIVNCDFYNNPEAKE